MVFLATWHEKIWTKIPGQQKYNEFFYEEKKIKNSFTHQGNKSNFVLIFDLKKVCERLWVTFDWSAASKFLKAWF